MIQYQKNAVILRRSCISQVFRRNTKSNLAEKDHDFCVRLIQLSDRRFHIGRTVDFQRIIHLHDTAGRKLN